MTKEGKEIYKSQKILYAIIRSDIPQVEKENTKFSFIRTSKV